MGPGRDPGEESAIASPSASDTGHAPGTQGTSRDGWRLIGTTLKSQWLGVTVGVVVGLLWTAAKVSVPALVQQAIDTGISPKDAAALAHWALAVGVAASIAATFTGIRRYWAFRESRMVEARLRDQLFTQIQKLHFAYHDLSLIHI